MKFRLFTLVIVVQIAIIGCKKSALPDADDPINPLYNQGINIVDTVSAQDEAILETYIMEPPSDDQFIGLDGNVVNGRGIEKNGTKNNIIKSIIKKGRELTRLKKTLSYPSEGSDKPAQNGLVYSFGQRDFEHRLAPPDGNELHRKYSVYGTDCSGLMINLLKNAGINISNNTSVSSFENNLVTALKATTNYKAVNIYNMGQGVTLDEIRTGDFIQWPGHIGFVCELLDGTKIMFQSNGTGIPKNEADQARNLGEKRGVKIINLTQAISGKGFWGTKYTILRFIEAGDSLQGGLVFYLNDDRKHGLICAPYDQASSTVWGPNVYVSGTKEDIGAGQENTAKIVSLLGVNSAAGICTSFELNGYKDWFLPSRQELNFICLNLYNRNLGNISRDFYWSSSDYYDNTNTSFSAYIIQMSNANSPHTFHSSKYAVRAIRKF